MGNLKKGVRIRQKSDVLQRNTGRIIADINGQVVFLISLQSLRNALKKSSLAFSIDLEEELDTMTPPAKAEFNDK